MVAGSIPAGRKFSYVNKNLYKKNNLYMLCSLDNVRVILSRSCDEDELLSLL